jgi:hypothetical protein
MQGLHARILSQNRTQFPGVEGCIPNSERFQMVHHFDYFQLMARL